jgi:hypothetical protein
MSEIYLETTATPLLSFECKIVANRPPIKSRKILRIKRHINIRNAFQCVMCYCYIYYDVMCMPDSLFDKRLR